MKSKSLKLKKVCNYIGMGLGKVFRFFCKFTLIFTILCFSIGIVLGSYVFVNIWPTVQGYQEIANSKFEEIGPNTFSYLGDTVVYDKNNEVIGKINVGNYKYIDIEDVSKYIQLGYMSVEDKNFKVHHGIDYKAILRAGLSIVKNGGKITQGGSTITQQVLKNNLLTQEKTLKRKLIEFFLAPEFEDKYSKQEILEFYLNTCFYGNNCYGIETASQYYFGKTNKNLDIAECAMLIGISNNGSLYNPRKNMEGCIKRQKIVLGEMFEDEVITEEEYENALKEELNFVYEREPRLKENYMTNYAIHCTILHIMETEGFNFRYIFDSEEDYFNYKESYSYRYGVLSNKVRNGGYQIYTSFDVEKQNKLQEILDKSTVNYTEVAEDGRYAFQSAAVLVNNETGYVEAMIGGRGTEDEFNRGFLAKRQPGSSIKPLVVYTPAFSTGVYYPSLKMLDAPNEEDEYFPKNYNGAYNGFVTLKDAIGMSINTIAYTIMKEITPMQGINYLGNLKFDTIAYEDYFNTSVALGGFKYGVRVVDMAKGYSTLINHGKYIDNDCVLKIEYQNQGVIFEENSNKISVYEPDAAYMAVDCCEGVMNNYYAFRKPNNAIVMGKSGTTNDAKDTWFVGGSVYYTLAVWCGYDMPRETNLSGSKLAAEIWQKCLTELHKGLEKKEFERPESVKTYPVNWEGHIVSYDSEEYGIFSQTLLDRAEDERKAQEERKKIERDNLFIEDIRTRLVELKFFELKDKDTLSTFENKVNKIEKDINRVYQTLPKIELKNELDKIKKFYSVDIRNIKEFLNRENVLKSVQEEVDLRNQVVDRLKELNDFIIDNIENIEIIENSYIEIENIISTFSKESDIIYYTNIYNIVKDKKEVELQPYREEKQRIEEELKESIVNSINEKLEILYNTIVYDDSVEQIYKELDSLFEEANELEIDTTILYSDYQRVKEEIERFFEPLLPEIENKNAPNVPNASNVPLDYFIYKGEDIED